ncbi:RDD family protein [Methanolobus sp.]|uniref:RDD family protein n=1 Tax=Methanolobus sp. TaxID=1874737 RepID=UPI0025E8D61C|nr:RDD family protein [Methanolobus sp.]
MPAHQYAGFWKRLLAAIFDTFLVTVVGGPISIILGVIVGSSIGSIVGLLGKDSFFPALLSTAFFFIGGIFLILRWLYFAIMESSSHQATFGKKLAGIKVTDMDGRKISFWRATLRHFAKILSAMVYYLGYLMIGFTEKKAGAARHDSWLPCDQ